jgi:hypothetical protein
MVSVQVVSGVELFLVGRDQRNWFFCRWFAILNRQTTTFRHYRNEELQFR